MLKKYAYQLVEGEINNPLFAAGIYTIVESNIV